MSAGADDPGVSEPPDDCAGCEDFAGCEETGVFVCVLPEGCALFVCVDVYPGIVTRSGDCVSPFAFTRITVTAVPPVLVHEMPNSVERVSFAMLTVPPVATEPLLSGV